MGDASAWERLVSLYAKRVFAMAKSRLGDPEVAEEITQAVFAKVSTQMTSGGYSEQGRFEAWLFRITMNRVRDEIRRAKRRPEIHASESLPFQPAQDRPGPDPELMAGLADALRALPEADREIVELRHIGQMSFKQIAEVLDEPMGTLLARHHRALRKLRGLFENGRTEERQAGS